jgi:hypothetical protein
MQALKRDRRGERGVSFLLVVAGIFSILAMAALAVDVATLYAVKSDAQKAADAAALAGAKMFVASSSTSGGSVDQADVCSNNTASSKMVNAAARTVAQQNTVGGVTAQITAIQCLGTDVNPRLKVTVGRSNLPLFFARVFGTQTATVSATATAEAYNNSGAANATKIAVGSVKPWLVENCSPGTSGASCTPNYFFAAGTNALPSPNTYLGTTLKLVPYSGPLIGGVTYYAAGQPALDAPNVCPPTAQTSCGGIGTPYVDDIACGNQHQVACGDTLPVSTTNLPLGTSATDTISGVECLIHASDVGLGQNQDILTASPGPAPPVTIIKGANNPHTPGVASGDTILQSDSVVTVPVFNYTADPCAGGTCGGTETVVGFLQLGVQQVENATGGGTSGTIDGVIVNAVGCNTAGAGTPVSGGGVSPIPVRLVQ